MPAVRPTTEADPVAVAELGAHAADTNAHSELAGLTVDRLAVNAIVMPVLGHTPTDADFTSPVNGMEAIDGTTNRKYRRAGGSWVQVDGGAIASFNPITYFGSALHAWYNADLITGLNDGDLVGSWLDQSGNVRALTAAGAARPTYKTAQQNGKAVVRFSGSNVMDTATFTAVPQPFAVFLTFKPTNGTLSQETPFAGVSGSVNIQAGTNGKHFFGSGSPTFANIGQGIKVNAWTQVSCIWGGAALVSRQRTNGKLTQSQQTAATTAPTKWRVGQNTGNAEGLIGDIGEIIVINRLPTDQEIADVENYLMAA